MTTTWPRWAPRPRRAPGEAPRVAVGRDDDLAASSGRATRPARAPAAPPLPRRRERQAPHPARGLKRAIGGMEEGAVERPRSGGRSSSSHSASKPSSPERRVLGLELRPLSRYRPRAEGCQRRRSASPARSAADRRMLGGRPERLARGRGRMPTGGVVGGSSRRGARSRHSAHSRRPRSSGSRTAGRASRPGRERARRSSPSPRRRRPRHPRCRRAEPAGAPPRALRKPEEAPLESAILVGASPLCRPSASARRPRAPAPPARQPGAAASSPVERASSSALAGCCPKTRKDRRRGSPSSGRRARAGSMPNSRGRRRPTSGASLPAGAGSSSPRRARLVISPGTARTSRPASSANRP